MTNFNIVSKKIDGLVAFWHQFEDFLSVETPTLDESLLNSIFVLLHQEANSKKEI